MAVNTTVAEKAAPQKEIGPDFAKEQIERWCEACHQFVLWEREHVIKGSPSAQEQEAHKTSLKWLLRLTRLIHAAVADADFPDRSLADMLRLTLWKLDQSWKTIYEAMPEAEAVDLMKKVFRSQSDQEFIKKL